MKAQEISDEIIRVQDRVRIVSIGRHDLRPIQRDYSWKLVVCSDPEAMRDLVGKPDSFRSWQMESLEFLQDVLSGIPGFKTDSLDTSEVSDPIFLCMWADAKTIS